MTTSFTTQANFVPSETQQQETPLRASVAQSVKTYLAEIGNQDISNLYEMLLSEIEEPLFKSLMDFTRHNQSRAAKMLGLSRGTLRKKLKQYGLL